MTIANKVLKNYRNANTNMTVLKMLLHTVERMQATESHCLMTGTLAFDFADKSRIVFDADEVYETEVDERE